MQSLWNSSCTLILSPSSFVGSLSDCALAGAEGVGQLAPLQPNGLIQLILKLDKSSSCISACKQTVKSFHCLRCYGHRVCHTRAGVWQGDTHILHLNLWLLVPHVKVFACTSYALAFLILCATVGVEPLEAVCFVSIFQVCILSGASLL